MNRTHELSLLLAPPGRHLAPIDRERAPGAMAQGQNRFARGLRFFAIATEVAKSLGGPLAWRLRLALGVDHDPSLMVRAAFQELLR